MDFNQLRDQASAALSGFFKKHLFDDLPEGDHPLANLMQPSLSGMLPYRGWDPALQLYQMEGSVGLVLEVDPLAGLDLTRTQILGQIFGDALPEGCHVQIFNWSSPKVGYKLRNWEMARSERGGIFRTLAKSRREHLSRGVWKSLSKSMPYHLRDFRVLLAFELKGFVDGEAGERLRNLKEVVRGTLNSLGSQSIVVDPDLLLDFARSVLNPCSSLLIEGADYDDNLPINQQIIKKDTSFRIYEDKIHTSAWNPGDRFEEVDGPPSGARTEKFEIRAFAVETFPTSCDQGRVNALIGDLFNGQIQPKGSNLTVLYFHNQSYPDSKSKTEMKALRVNQQAASPMAKLNPSVGKAAADWNAVNESVIAGARLASVMMFTLQTSPRDQGEDDERYLRTVWMNAGFMIQRCDNMHLPFLVAGLPLTMGQGLHEEFQRMKRTRTMPSDKMALLAPMQAEPMGFRRPDMLFAGRRGQLFNWSPFSNEGEGNHNCAIVGGSGAGKSVLMAEAALGLFGAGAHIMVIDDGESFKNLCLMVGGEHVDFDLNEGLCINPFSMIDFNLAVRDLEYASDNKSGIVDLVLQMARGTEKPTSVEQGVVSNAVNHVWEEKGKAGRVHDVAVYLRDNEGDLGQNLFKSMTDYIEGGQFYELFNDTCNLEVKSDFMVFELSPLEAKPGLRAVVVLSLLMLIAQRMKFIDRRIKKGLIIDEAWKLLADGAAGSFIEGFARRCRKMGGALITGTQSLDDYEKTAGSRACIQNSEWLICMKVKPESLAKFEQSNVLRVSEGEMRVLGSLKTIRDEFSEAYIRGPGCRVVGRLIVDPYTLTVFDTRPDTWAAVQEMVEAGIPIEQAVYNVANKIKTRTAEQEAADVRDAEVFAMYPELRRLARRYLTYDEGQRKALVRLAYAKMGEGSHAA